jgi:hypothetical protein
LQHVLFGYDLLYLLRGAPTLLYGDEVGMIGSGGDKAAREDMFPTQVTDWQTEARVGSPPIGKGSSFDVRNNPIEAQLRTLSALRETYPALSTGSSIVRVAKDAVLVVSRIDFATGREVVTAFNNGTTTATVKVATSTPGATWSTVFGTGTASGDLTLAIPPISAVVAVPSTSIPKTAVAAPKLSTGEDALTSYYKLGAAVTGAPASVTFAVQGRGGAWQRVAIDDSVPYRGFLDPARFKRGEKVSVVAVARGLDGSTAASKIASVVPNP